TCWRRAQATAARAVGEVARTTGPILAVAAAEVGRGSERVAPEAGGARAPEADAEAAESLTQG
ncbi:MAG: hypothetical protein AAB075_02000, partial [Gemmatimonadota bacterium]